MAAFWQTHHIQMPQINFGQGKWMGMFWILMNLSTLKSFVYAYAININRWSISSNEIEEMKNEVAHVSCGFHTIYVGCGAKKVDLCQ